MTSLMITACVGPLLLDGRNLIPCETDAIPRSIRAIDRVDGTRLEWRYGQQDHGPRCASRSGESWQVLMYATSQEDNPHFSARWLAPLTRNEATPETLGITVSGQTSQSGTAA